MEKILAFLPNNPLVAFTILLLVILTLPPLFERIKLPGLVGLIFAGVVLGKNGLNLLDGDSESMRLLEDIGKIYLMFVAGLEIDLGEFRKTKNRSLGFGFATFIIPLIIGTLIGRAFDYGWNGAILIGSLFASHTLLGYPIVQRLGVVRNEAVMVTIGATIFTDISALVVLAVCLSIHQGDFSAASLIFQLVALGIYCLIVLFGLDWAGKKYFERTGDEESNQFLFVLFAVFLAALGAQVINVEKIVGAFLAGLAVNDVLGRSPVKEKIEFMGSTLFIPMFFVAMGLLLDVPIFIKTITTQFPLMLAVVVGLIVAKFLAAFISKLIYHYNFNEGMTMWSLSLPQVAATLAAALAAYQAQNAAGERLLNEATFNSVIVLMLVTSILGPLLTARFARNLSVPKPKLDDTSQTRDIILSELLPKAEPFAPTHPFTIVVPIYNPTTQRNLIEMAALIAHHESGVIVPLSVTTSHVRMDSPQLNTRLYRSREMLGQAVQLSQEFEVEAQPAIRIDDKISHGISRAAREKNADLIIMGWSKTFGLRARLFGTVIDSVFRAAHCPVAVMRLLDEPINIHNLLVPVKNITPEMIRVIRFAHLLADTNKGSVTLLHICDRRTSSIQIAAFKEDLLNLVNRLGFPISSEIKTVFHYNVSEVIIRESKSFDLTVLRSVRRQTVGGGLAVSDLTTELLKRLTGSLVLFGEPENNT
jgi:Kef-type K+ transport system membrane component KefB/nucleotide-binding universal stress UspA family protein